MTLEDVDDGGGDRIYDDDNIQRCKCSPNSLNDFGKKADYCKVRDFVYILEQFLMENLIFLIP